MSLGAITSAPARAWLAAGRASSSSEASLSTVPSSRMTPQCPWLVYSHRQTSVITRRAGWARWIARTASCTAPSSSQAPEPSASLWSGIPKSSTPGTPSAASSPAAATASVIVSRETPGIDSIGAASVATNIGAIRRAALNSVSRTRSRSALVRRSRRSRVSGKDILTDGSGAACQPRTTGPSPAQGGAREQPEARDQRGEVGERDPQARAALVDRRVDRLQRRLEGEDRGDDADHVIESGGDRALGHEGEEDEREGDEQGQQRG